MKVGDYVTTQEIASQSICRWVVLTDLVESKNFYGIEGGIIHYIADTKDEAGDVWVGLGDIDSLLVSGSLPEEALCLGGVVFVE
jgi:hypothetical protein